MKKISTSFVCQSCHYKIQKWHGKCPECQTWNSFEEELNIKSISLPKRLQGKPELNIGPIALDDVKEIQLNRLKTQISEFDRVLGGGIVSSSILLLAGDPGVGKSTLLASALKNMLENNSNEVALYISGEESIDQIAQRMRRINIKSDRLFLFCERNLQEIKKQILKINPRLLIVDSIQTIYSDQIDSQAGTSSQIKEVTDEIIALTKTSSFSSIIVGHITKEGAIAGPKSLEHMVDAVLYFENAQNNEYRILRAIKNRFGPTTEIGIFEMNHSGIHEVKTIEHGLTDKILKNDFGRSKTAILEGSRVLTIETQSLVNENKYGQGKRLAQGFDVSRLQMLIAVMEKFLSIKIHDYDIYVNMIGIETRSAKGGDLAIIASILSSLNKVQVDREVIFVGEIGLCGEVRPVNKDRIIVDELVKLNYKKIIVSSQTKRKIQESFVKYCIAIDHVSEITGIIRAKNENISFNQ